MICSPTPSSCLLCYSARLGSLAWKTGCWPAWAGCRVRTQLCEVPTRVRTDVILASGRAGRQDYDRRRHGNRIRPNADESPPVLGVRIRAGEILLYGHHNQYALLIWCSGMPAARECRHRQTPHIRCSNFNRHQGSWIPLLQHCLSHTVTIGRVPGEALLLAERIIQSSLSVYLVTYSEVQRERAADETCKSTKCRLYSK